VCAAIFNDRGELLPARPHGASLWELPGEAIEPDESIQAALACEITQEIGVAITIERLLAVDSSPVFDVRCENGDAIHPIMFMFAARIPRRSLEASEFVATEEIAETGYFPEADLAAMRPCCQQKARDAFHPPSEIVDPSS
jgi:ADP-ribose pyrophosphatase YjhB (NUDIX family)